MTVLEKIDKLRVERGWSVYKLAEEAAITQSTINNLYARKTEPKLSTLRSICNAFDMSLSEFFAEEEPNCDTVDAEIKAKIETLNSSQKKALLNFLKNFK